MKKLTTVGALALCTLLSGCSHTEKCSGTDNLLRADLYIYRLTTPQDTLAYSFHASTTEPSGDVATWSRSLHPELAIAYHPGKTLMIGDTVAPANKSAMIAFITPTNH